MTDGEKIKHIRSLLKLTQQEFASKLGISQGTVTSLEKGRNKEMSFTVFRQLVRVFKVNPYYFLSGGNEPEFSSRVLNSKIKKYETLIDKLYELRRC